MKFGVPVTTLVCGDKEKQIPLDKLAAHIRKLPKALQGSEVLDVAARLRALDAMRPKVPLPKGPLPTSAKPSAPSAAREAGRRSRTSSRTRPMRRFWKACWPNCARRSKRKPAG